MKHANISIFVPHLGCPNDCSFCNQRHITGMSKEPCEQDIINVVLVAVASKNFSPENTEIAFFGGSFTAIDRSYMLRLLKTADEQVKFFGLRGIRISTRPDCIDDEILTILKDHSVTAIELGAQSLNDSVLALNDRGHTAKNVENASALIKDYGFELGLQMMTGLYGDTNEKALDTASKIVSMSPDTVRIYPTIVLKNTKLAELYDKGLYKPQTLDEAISLCSELLALFEDVGIKVIRLGLHSIEEDSFLAGPWHPAFSELCNSYRFLKQITDSCEAGKTYTIEVNPVDISKAIGQKRANLDKLSSLGIKVQFIQNDNISKNTLKIREVNKG